MGKIQKCKELRSLLKTKKIDWKEKNIHSEPHEHLNVNKLDETGLPIKYYTFTEYTTGGHRLYRKLKLNLKESIKGIKNNTIII